MDLSSSSADTRLHLSVIIINFVVVYGYAAVVAAAPRL